MVVRIFDRMESAYGLVSNSGSFENSKKQKDKELEARHIADPSVLFMVDFLQFFFIRGQWKLWGILWDDDGMY